MGQSRLEVGSKDGGGTDTEEDVLRQRAGSAGRSSAGLASVGGSAVGGRGMAAGLSHGGGSEDGDDSSSTHFEGWWLFLGVWVFGWSFGG